MCSGILEKAAIVMKIKGLINKDRFSKDMDFKPMKFRTIKYHIKQGTTSLIKNRLMAAASIFTVAACSFIFIISLCLVINLNETLKHFEDTVGISTFVGDEVTDEDLKYIRDEIEKIEYIKDVRYVSKKDALDWAKERWSDDSAILDGFEHDNPFSRGFDLTFTEIKYQNEVIKKLEELQLSFEKEYLKKNGLVETVVDVENKEITTNIADEEEALKPGERGYEFKGIRKIRHSQKLADMLININNVLRIVSIVLILIMGIVSFSIIINTIKLTVFIRKNEINIMKYIGATDAFIRFPFVVEGLLIGLIGSFIPCVICWISYHNVVRIITEKIWVIQNMAVLKSSSSLFLTITPLTLVLGIFLGVFGSIMSIKRHLNV